MTSSLVRVRSLACALTVVVGAACGSASTASSPVLPSIEAVTNQEFELAVGQTAALGSPAVTVRFDTVTADSRCPIDAVCVWAGDAALRFTVRVGEGTPRSVELHSFTEPKLVTEGGATVELLRVMPATNSRKAIALTDYRARLIVRSGS